MPGLSTHDPLIVVEAQEPPGPGNGRGTRWCQSQGPPWCAGLGMGDVSVYISWLEEDKKII